MPLGDLVPRSYYKSTDRWNKKFWRGIKKPDGGLRAPLAEWLVERLEATHPGRLPTELRGVKRRPDGSEAAVLWTVPLAGD